MAAIGTVQLAGNANAGPAEVELNTLAFRGVVRPYDVSYFGSYRSAGAYTICSASAPSSAASVLIPTNRIIYSWFMPPGRVWAWIHKISVSLTQFDATARTHFLNLVRATNYDYPCVGVVDVGSSATNNTPGGQYITVAPIVQVPSKLRAQHADSAASIIVPPSPTNSGPRWEVGLASGGPTLFTGVTGNAFLMDFATVYTQTQTQGPLSLGSNAGIGSAMNPNIGDNWYGVNTSAGAPGQGTLNPPRMLAQSNRSVDPQPVGSIYFPATAAGSGLPMTPIIDQPRGNASLVLGPACGFEIQWTTTAAFSTARCDVAVDVHWDEIEANF